MLLDALVGVREGDFGTRLPHDWTGIDGRIADTVNEIAIIHEKFARAVEQVAFAVGTDGRLGERMKLDRTDGAWGVKLNAINSMIDNLVQPVREVGRVIGAVARGTLTESIQLEIDGRALKGEFLKNARTINTMLDQLNSFSSEVTRVAREVGTEGKLGGQAEVKGASGVWKDLTDNVNLMASNLTAQVRNIAEVTTAVAQGDLSRKITVDVKGEILRLKETINLMVDQLNSFAGEVTRVAREVGTEGKLGGQADVKGVSGVWKDLTENVNLMANNLTGQVRNIAEVTTAVAKGDLSRKITVDVKGEILRLKDTINLMVDQLNSFAGEVTRVAREVGTEGKLGGQADVKGVAGVWKDLTENVNLMAGNLTDQVRNIAEVTTAVARGNLSRKITVGVRGEILQLKDTINIMVDQLNSFAGEVTRVAREVGTEGKLGGQAEVKDVDGVWKDLTDSVNAMASNLTGQVRNIAFVTTAVAKGDLSRKITADAKGEVLELKSTINIMVDQLNSFAGEVTRVAREVGTEGKLGGQAQVQDVSGVWKDLTDSVNAMAGNLTVQLRDVSKVSAAIASGDLGQKITVEVQGEILQIKDVINGMVDQLKSFSGEVTRVAVEVGTEGRLGGQAEVAGVSGVWKNLTDSVNLMASNLTAQVRNIAAVTTAVANGDLSQKIRVDVRGEVLQLKDTINNLVDQLNSFSGEVTRVAREVGTEGKLGGQADVQGLSGVWKDLTDNVNRMASNLTAQVRNIAAVTTAVANGDLSQKITVDVQGEVLQLKDTINIMVDQLNSFAGEVTRVALEVGTEGRLGGQAQVTGVAGTWKNLTDSVNLMASNLTGQVRNIAAVTTAVANGDLSQKITVDVRGEVLQLKDTINIMVDQLNAFAGEVTRVAREVGIEGRLGGQAQVKGVSGVWRGLTDNVNLMASQPDRPGAQHRHRHHRGGQRRPVEDHHRRRPRRGAAAQADHQHHGRPAARLRRRGDAGGARGRHRRAPRRPGLCAGRGGRMEGPHRQRQPDGQQPDRPGAQHRHRHHRGGQRRPVAQDHRRRAGRNPRAEKHHQHHGRPAQRVRRRSDAGGARGRHRGPARRPGPGQGRLRRLEGAHRQRQPDGGQPDRPGARHGQGGDRRRRRQPETEDDGAGQGRGGGAGRHHQRHGRHAGHFQRPGHAGGARGRRRRAPRRPGGGAGRRRQLEGPGRQRQRTGGQPVDPGAGDRRGGHRGHQGRPRALDPGRRARRSGGPEGQPEPDDPQPQADHRTEYRAGLAEDQPGAPEPHAAGPARHRQRGPHAAVRTGAAGGLAARGAVPDAGSGQGPGRRRRAAPDPDGHLRLPGAQEPVEGVAHRRGRGRPGGVRKAAPDARPTCRTTTCRSSPGSARRRRATSSYCRSCSKARSRRSSRSPRSSRSRRST